MDYKLFKWIGGKSWLSKTLNEKIENILSNNKNIDTYVEPFCGGLGSFFSLLDTLEKYNINKIILNDINNNLINLYKVIENNPKELIKEFKILENNFKITIPVEAYKLNKTKDKLELKILLKETNDFYLEKRKELNNLIKNNSQDIYKKSALTLFVLKHNFNGIYRENNKGEINSPFNWEALNLDLDLIEKKINKLNELFNLKNIEFTNYNIKDFFIKTNLDYTKTLFYYDPPYMNEIELSENSYSKEGFNNIEQIDLIKNIINTNKYFLYSNHSNEKIINLFNDFKIDFLYRKNIITPNPLNRGLMKEEILISSN